MHIKNSKEYWDVRFSTNDWAEKGGNIQTLQYAKQYVQLLDISRNFNGILCDFGCAQGDAFPVYHSAFPHAKLIGIDFSKNAIKHSIKKYGNIANFICGGVQEVPDSNIIISSHTFEHLEDDYVILKGLLRKCHKCFVIVPYREDPIAKEHLRIYNKNSFSEFNPYQIIICSAGWTIVNRIYRIFLKNLLRSILGYNTITEPKQIIFAFNGSG